MKKNNFLFLLLAAAMFAIIINGCKTTCITLAQSYRVESIDTIGNNISVRVKPVGKRRSAYGYPVKAGDTLTALVNATIN